MQEIAIQYERLSPKRVRIQLIIVGISLIIAGYANVEQSSIFLMILAFLSMAGGLAHVIISFKYKFFQSLLGGYLNFSIFSLTAIILALDGISYAFQGSRYIQYAYFALAILNVTLLPTIILKQKVFLSEKGITVRRVIRPDRLFLWKEAESVSLNDAHLIITTGGKTYTYWLSPESDAELASISDFLRMHFPAGKVEQ